jgi:hypothetical protein
MSLVEVVFADLEDCHMERRPRTRKSLTSDIRMIHVFNE